MEAAFLREFARRCHDLMLDARTEAARRQLALWVEEFERRAEALEQEPTRQAAAGTKPTG
jgi:hypothetical protein